MVVAPATFGQWGSPHTDHTETFSDRTLVDSDSDTEFSTASLTNIQRQKHLLRRGTTALARLGWHLIPRFLRPGGLNRPEKLHPTSYLDSVRGYASWVVVNHHRFDLQRSWVFQLPFINTIYRGRGMVDVFFVISGFVLTQRMIKQIQSNQQTKLMESLASSIFRRYLRLYLPCMLATFISMCFAYMGWAFLEVPHFNTFTRQFWHWCGDMVRFSNPFAHVVGWWYPGLLTSDYDYPLWTIGVEFQGSMIVFLFCAGLSGLRSKHRLTVVAGVAFLAMVWQATYVALFLCGMFLAEHSLLQHPDRYAAAIALPFREKQREPAPKQSLGARLGYTCVFLFSIFLLGMPREAQNSFWPWPYLAPIAPPWWEPVTKRHFWSAVASPLLIWSLDSCVPLQTPLRWRFSLYLGEVSFGIYAMHVLVKRSLYVKVLLPFVRHHVHKPLYWYTPIIIINWLVVLWVADYFTRVDKKVVRLARWLEQKYTRPGETSPNYLNAHTKES